MVTYNVDKNMALKIIGCVCTVAGTVIGLITTQNDNAKNTEKAVEKFLNSESK